MNATDIEALRGVVRVLREIVSDSEQGIGPMSSMIAKARLLAARLTALADAAERGPSREELLAALRQAASQFRYYEQQHRAKKTRDADLKAEVNDAMASSLESLLARAGGA